MGICYFLVTYARVIPVIQTYILLFSDNLNQD